MGRPYVVHKADDEGIGDDDPVPGWLGKCCVYNGICL